MSTIALPLFSMTKKEKKTIDEKLAAVINGYFPFAFRVKKLLVAHANPNHNIKITTKNGTYTLSILHIASYLGLYEIVKLLLDAGANPHAKDEAGRTPFLMSIRPNNKKVIRLYLEQISPNHTDKRGWGVFHYGINQRIERKMLSLFLKKGANPNLKTRKSCFKNKKETPLDFVNTEILLALTPKEKKFFLRYKKFLQNHSKNQTYEMQTGVKIVEEIAEKERISVIELPDLTSDSIKESNSHSRISSINLLSKVNRVNPLPRIKEHDMKINKTEFEEKFKKAGYVPGKYTQRIDAVRVNGHSFTHKTPSYEIRFTLADGGLMPRMRKDKDSPWEYLLPKELPTGKRNGKTKRFVVINDLETIRLYLEIIFEKEEVSKGRIRTVKNFYVHEEKMLSHLLVKEKEFLSVSRGGNTSNPHLKINLEEFNLNEIKIMFENGKPHLVSGPIKRWKAIQDDFEEPTVTKVILPVDDCIVVLSAPPDESFENATAQIMSKQTFDSENEKIGEQL